MAGAVVALAWGALAPVALAQDAPHWALTIVSGPASFAPGDTGDEYTVSAINTGGAATDGTPVTITDALPPGLTATAINGGDLFSNGLAFSGFGGNATCDTSSVTCTFDGNFDSGDSLIMTITVSVDASVSGAVSDSATVSGGGPADAAASASTAIGSSAAAFGFAPGSVVAATTTSQAGAHPDLTTSFSLNRRTPILPAGNARDVTVDLPSGLVGSATAVPQCDMTRVVTGTCPTNTMVGVATVTIWQGGDIAVDDPIFNIAPYDNEPAAFGFSVLGFFPVRLDTSVRSGSDYGITTTAPDLFEGAPVLSTTVMLWGVPGDHNGPGPDTTFSETGDVSFGGPGAASSRAALLTNPTQCSSSPPTVSLSTTSWPQGTTQPSTADSASATLPAITGCDKLQFNPSLTVRPDTTVADSPAGINAELKLPQDSNPDGLATPELRNATVTLPPGLSVSPAAADGLQGCTDAQIALHSTAPATCPDASQIGTVSIHTPLLPDTLTGQIYLGTPNCDPCTNADAQDGNMLRGFIQAQGDGVIIKLPGFFTADPATGQLTAHFLDNPQQPFDDLQLHFKGGPRGIVATPEACGTYTADGDLSPWSSPFTPDANTSDSFTIDSGCVSGFSPSFTAGTQDPQAGAYSPFVLSLSRSDTDQNFSGLSVKLPPGMLAKLAGVQECSDAQLAQAATNSASAEQASPSCPAGSQVGAVTTGAGPGPDPFFLSGKAYLTGPYKGAPYGLAIVVPALAGPFDLGTVVVRQALFIDPTTAQVTDVSDPFPTILDGIPLDLRRIDVDLNRPGFTVNPTSCDPMSITGTATSTQGATANLSSNFQVGGCQDIGFTPNLKIALTGKGKTESGDHPTLTATLTDPAGQANIQSAKVALPLSLALDPNNSNNVCATATADAVHGGAVGCPTSTIVGTATAVTPLLSQPLTGNVYLVQGIRTNSQGQKIKTLPTLLVPLRGQIALDLRARTSVSGGKLVTTFPTIPDAAVSKFTLNIDGGKKGLLVVTGRGLNICQKNQVGNANFGAQSGKTTQANMTLSTPCGKPAQLKVLSHQVKAGRLLLRVTTSERGKVTVTGNGLRSFDQTIGAGTHQISVGVRPSSDRKPATKRAKVAAHAKNTKPGAKQSKQRAKTLKVTVQVTPANAKPATRTFTVNM